MQCSALTRHPARSLGNCGHLLPASVASRHVGIIAGRIGAVIPVSRRRIGNRRRDRGRWRRQIGVGIRINRFRIPVPVESDNPPPALAPAMRAMEPAAAAPDGEIIAMKAVYVAMPRCHAQMACSVLASVLGHSRQTECGDQGQGANRKVKCSHDHALLAAKIATASLDVRSRSCAPV